MKQRIDVELNNRAALYLQSLCFVFAHVGLSNKKRDKKEQVQVRNGTVPPFLIGGVAIAANVLRGH